ncbi:MAG: T9SS type A sorting domain-containing protein [Melioribacteraceae bacterium]|nr:T9SS type A sorting domain-containing protein [Melioribacteraceae bacterium]
MKKLFTFLVLLTLLFSQYQILAQAPLSPLHGQPDVSVTPTIAWDNYMGYADAAAGTYSIQIYKNDSGAYTLIREINFIHPWALAYDVDFQLQYSASYEWFVKGSTEAVWHGNSGGNTGQGFTFFTLTPLPAELDAPVNGVTGVSIEPQFTWHPSNAVPNDYHFYLAKDDAFTQPVYDFLTDATTFNYNEILQNTLPNVKLDYNTKYYWKVVSIYPDNSFLPHDADANPDELPSAVSHFTTLPETQLMTSWPAHLSSINLNTSVMFSWGLNQPVGTMKFRLQICQQTVAPVAADWANGAITTTYPFQNTTTKTVSNLFQGTDYWWRVKLYNSADQVIGYSDETFFTTEGGATVVATPSYPINGETIYQLNPTLYWYIDQYATGVTYRVWYCPDAGDANINGRLDDEAGALNSGAYSSDLYKQLAGLLNGKTYYWQVEVYYAATGQSSFSAIETFKTEGPGTLLKPIASYPIDDVTVYTTSPYLYWYLGGSSAGLVYDLEYVVSNGAFTNNPSVGCNDIPELYKQISGLIPGVTYKWQVRTDNGATQSAWSDAGTFVVAGGAANTYPIVTYPLTEETVYTITPTLYWYLEGSNLGVTNYTVKWYKGAGTPGGGWLGYAPGANDANGGSVTVPATDTYVQIPVNLTYGALYYWAVSANNGIAPSAFSEGSFTVAGGAAAGVAVLSQPANHEIVYGRDVNFGWFMPGGTFGVTNYTLTYSRSDVFAIGADAYGAITSSVTLDNLFMTVNGLIPGATYYWYVTANYGDGTSASSLHQDFTIFTSSLAVQPRIGGPDNLTVPVASPVLSWIVPFKTNTLYDLEVADNAGFDNKSVYTGINSTFKKVDELEKGKDYFWRVQGKDTEGNTTYYSGTGKFTIDASITSVEEQPIPNEYSLEQNYPNPFNPTTVIQFNMPKSGLASLKIFDILGREIITLVNEIKEAGTHKVTWNGIGLASGVYIYKLTTGDYSSIKKMALIK